MTAKLKTISRQEELMYAFNFTEIDLEANRAGQLSVDQMQNLKSNKKLRALRFMLVGIVASLLWSCWFVVAILRPNTPVYVYMLFIFFIGMSVIPVIIAYFEYSEINSEIAQGIVEKVEGSLQKSAVSWLNQRITVDRLRLKANRDGLQHIRNEAPHIVYFLPHSKIIVSVEVVES